MFHQLLYVSTAIYPRDDLSNISILATSLQKNAQNDITGCLLRSPTRFLQVLEGPQDNVHETFERILYDKRHHSVQALLERSSPVRDFSEWSMEFAQATPDLQDEIELAIVAAKEGLWPYVVSTLRRCVTTEPSRSDSRSDSLKAPRSKRQA